MPSTQRTISLATPAPRGTDAAPASSPSERLVMGRPDCGRNFWGLSTARTKNHPNGRCLAHPPPPKITPTGDARLIHHPRNAPFAAIGLTATPALRGRSWGGRTRTEAGEEGLEPSNGGSKVRCLTTWLLPSGTSDRSQPSPAAGRLPSAERPRRCSPVPGRGVPAASGALPEAQTWMWTRGMRSRMQPGRPAAGRRQPQLRRIAVSRSRRASRLARGRRSGPRSEAL